MCRKRRQRRDEIAFLGAVLDNPSANCVDNPFAQGSLLYGSAGAASHSPTIVRTSRWFVLVSQSANVDKKTAPKKLRTVLIC